MNQFDNDVSIDRFEMFDDRHYRKVDLRYFCQSAAPCYSLTVLIFLMRCIRARRRLRGRSLWMS
jgi:hypothetical protein